MEIHMWEKSQDVSVSFKAGHLINIIIFYSHEHIRYTVNSDSILDDATDCVEILRTDWNGNILPAKEERQ